MANWETLAKVLRISGNVVGSWRHAVQKVRERYAVPPRQGLEGGSGATPGAIRYHLKKYHVEEVEPRVFAEAERELQQERSKPDNALYNALHPGQQGVAELLQGHGWGPRTISDYKKWTASVSCAVNLDHASEVVDIGLLKLSGVQSKESGSITIHMQCAEELLSKSS